MQTFGPATRRYVESAFAHPTPVQERGWPLIASGQHALLFAPTGSGKTLAAFLASLDKLTRTPLDDAPTEGVRVLYVSPLKALVFDVEKNLRGPLVGIQRAGEALGVPLREVRVDVRTGDTPSKERARQLKSPPDVLVTTPESLYLMLTSGAHEALKSVQTVIVDEIHALAGSKRGVHLALSLERLSHLAAAHTGHEPQRIGLSATQRPLEAIARYLGGDRPVQIVDASAPPRLALTIEVPGEALSDTRSPPPAKKRKSGPLLSMATDEDRAGAPVGRGKASRVPNGNGDGTGAWPVLYPAILEKVLAHRSTIVFVNSRLLCERLAQRLNDLAGPQPLDDGDAGATGELAMAHHGSLSHRRRAEIEDRLKQGKLRCLVATSSLELGVDMGAVDLVILVESPGAASRGLQRIGRAGHGVGQTSNGVMLPKFKGDLLECAVVGMHMQEGKLEATRVPERCLDVLAQHVVAMVSMQPWHVPDLLALVRRASPYASLSREVFDAVLDMLSGKYPSDAFADLVPRVVWDRTEDRLTPRKGARALALLNAGTIPDRGTYGVHLGVDGPRIGELDEEMVFESRSGDAIVLGASTWRIDEITRDRVNVTPAPGESGKLPFWHGERPGRPVELGRAIGELLREVEGKSHGEIERVLERTPLDASGRRVLAGYIAEQHAHVGGLPTDRAITVESFKDELGDWRTCILTPFGAKVHAAWAQCIQARMANEIEGPPQIMWSDDGVALKMPDNVLARESVDRPPDTSLLFPDPDDVDDLLLHALPDTSLFATRFRENAARALLLPRKGFRGRTPLYLQRKKSQDLLGAARKHASFPIVLETYRECLQDVLDVPTLKDLLRGVKSRAVRVDVVETRKASPFSRSLVFAYIAAYLYDGDAPLSERRAQALALDRTLLAELLGAEELKDLIDPRAVEEVRAEVGMLEDDRKVTHADAVHDLLRRLGDLTPLEIQARTDGDAQPLVDALVRARRAVLVRIAGEQRLVAVEDAARYRDALGSALPSGIPDAFLAQTEGALEGLVARWARTHGPFFIGEVAARFGLLPAQVEPALAQLRAKGTVLAGTAQGELCDAEVLRRLKRRTLAKLRDEVAPVDGDSFARFLAAWHGIGSSRRGTGRLEEAIAQLEGVPLQWSILEEHILPARVGAGTDGNSIPGQLDELGAMGALVWIGAGASGKDDGRVRLYRRERVPLLLDAPAWPPDPTAPVDTNDDGPVLGDAHARIMEHLLGRGASFSAELLRASGLPDTKALMDALWDLVWRGLVTNDTFQPLRGLRARSSARRPRHVAMLGGRWSAVASLVAAAPSPTERLHARALALLERCGVVSREAAADEPGGFAALYPVLRALEESGRVRRGHFVDGLTGAQFALPGAVERLRAARGDDAEDEARILSAVDPALPWGSLLDWPAAPTEGGRDGQQPKRIGGARVVTVGGRPVLYVERGNKSLLTFPAARDGGPDLERAVRLLLQKQDYQSLRLARVDGAPADESESAPLLVNAGFVREPPGLVLSRV